MRTRNPFRYGSRVTGGAFFDRERIIRDVLELPAKICPAGRTLVVFDEFQEVESLGLGQQFERTMRSVIQNQPDIAYVFLELEDAHVGAHVRVALAPVLQFSAENPTACMSSCLKIKEKTQ